MAKCNFCKEDIKSWDTERAGYLIASMNKDGDNSYHTHVHGTISDKNIMEDLITSSIQETGLTDLFKQKYGNNQLNLTEIIFHNRQRIGDMIMFTCAVRDFKKAYPHIKVNVISTCGHFWDHNPYVDRSIQPYYKEGVTLETIKPIDLLEGRTNVLKIGPSKLTNSSNRIDWHFANAFRVSIEENLGIKIQQGESRGDLWFTKEEYNAPRITEKPYWIIVTGGEKGWGCKMYPTVRWQEVVDQNPDILFYQLGAKGDAHQRLVGPNVVDYIGKTEDRNTGIRDLMKLFLNAEGSIGLVSFHMHLSGALNKPSVVVAGAREPVSFTRYAGHQYIATDGTLPCATTACWHCDIKACTNPVTVNGEIVPKCVDMIDSAEVSRYLNRYYVGGRLRKDKPSEKPKLTNIVDTPSSPKIVETPKSNVNTYGLEFNGGALTERDWEFISGVIDEHKVKSVLEFGAGLSTLLLNDKLKDVVTYEDKQAWIDKLNKLKPGMDIRLWDGKTLESRRNFDLAFVDGPAGDSSREMSTQIASHDAPIVIVHDAGREWARKYQEIYLTEKFDGPFKGGHRCHLWISKSVSKAPKPIENTPKIEKAIKVPTSKKFVKFVSTARGWGGCARSITTMMKMLLEEGHHVEFIPFRNSIGSREFQEFIKSDLKDLKVTLDYNSINEKCDTFFMYADDYIWEFDNGDVCDTFSDINADKKIMTLNYRRGKVGNTEWTKNWDKYLFLNKNQELELLRLLPNAKTRVLAPCTDLSEFFKVTPSFDDMVKIVRHSSQGDTKFSKNFGDELANVHDSRQDLSITMMPGPSFIQDGPRFKKVLRNIVSIPEFLSQGNLFWYSLPQDYMDMGPRVIIEAMAAGLPILADNWGGAVDRVTPECGWLCNKKSEMADIVKNVSMDELQSKGIAARQRAKDEFIPRNWIKEIVE